MKLKDEYWMKEAIKLAQRAQKNGDTPIGAIVVKENKIIGKGYNEVEKLADPTAHAEIIAITSASSTMGKWRLNGTTIYVTVEPCPMCAGAIYQARISRCVFGVRDRKMGGLVSNYQIKRKNMKIKEGILGELSVELLKEFFKNVRKKKKKEKK
jgi:tRNA(adenine34) deaminase